MTVCSSISLAHEMSLSLMVVGMTLLLSLCSSAPQVWPPAAPAGNAAGSDSGRIPSSEPGGSRTHDLVRSRDALFLLSYKGVLASPARFERATPPSEGGALLH